MKAHYIQNKAQSERIAHRVAKEELQRQKDEFCPKCVQKVGNQILAVVCKALHMQYGFGKKRLRRLCDSTDNLFDLLAAYKDDYNANQAVEWLKERMGIDLVNDYSE